MEIYNIHNKNMEYNHMKIIINHLCKESFHHIEKIKSKKFQLIQHNNGDEFNISFYSFFIFL